MPSDPDNVPSATALIGACALCNHPFDSPVHWVAPGATVQFNGGNVVAAHHFVDDGVGRPDC